MFTANFVAGHQYGWCMVVQAI